MQAIKQNVFIALHSAGEIFYNFYLYDDDIAPMIIKLFFFLQCNFEKFH